MSISSSVKQALQKAGKKQLDLAAEWGYSDPKAVSNKFFRGSWSGSDLASVAEFTGGKLAFVYPDGQQIFIYPDKETNARGKTIRKNSQQQDDD